MKPPPPPNADADDSIGPTQPRTPRTQPRTRLPQASARREPPSTADESEPTVPGTRPIRSRPVRTQPVPVQKPVAVDAARPLPITRPVGGLQRYRIGEELGRGGIGIVTAATDPALRREIAIKRLLHAHNIDARHSFIEEAQITGQLEHPNIVPIHELGHDDAGRPFLAMKRVQGRTLRDVLRESAEARRTWRQDEAALLTIFAKIGDALAYAHARGVIHRDLKPENVMVGDFGEVLAMDWGLAKPLHAHAHDRRETAAATAPSSPTNRRAILSDRRADGAEHTVDGEVFGTPAYMAPEQARGEWDCVDERADIFALGAILYALLTLHAPFTGNSAVAVIANAATGNYEPARQRAPGRDIPKELAAIAAKAMAPTIADRYATVGDLLADIAAYQAFEPLTARRDDPLTAGIKWMRRHPRLTLGGGLSLVFGLVVAVLVVQLQSATQAAELAQANVAREAAERLSAQQAAQLAEQHAQQARIAEAAVRGDLAAVRALLKKKASSTVTPLSKNSCAGNSTGNGAASTTKHSPPNWAKRNSSNISRPSTG